MLVAAKVTVTVPDAAVVLYLTVVRVIVSTAAVAAWALSWIFRTWAFPAVIVGVPMNPVSPVPVGVGATAHVALDGSVRVAVSAAVTVYPVWKAITRLPACSVAPVGATSGLVDADTMMVPPVTAPAVPAVTPTTPPAVARPSVAAATARRNLWVLSR